MTWRERIWYWRIGRKRRRELRILRLWRWLPKNLRHMIVFTEIGAMTSACVDLRDKEVPTITVQDLVEASRV